MTKKVATAVLIVTVSAFLSSCDNGGVSAQALFGAQISAQTSGFNLDVSETGAVYQVASHVESAADQLYSHAFAMLKQPAVSHETDTQFCDTDGTAVITVYSTNGKAQHEIDVKLDGSPIGSLTTYFPKDGPGCKTPSAEGVITLMVPAGKHTLEAASPNLVWPSHNFSVGKCECMSLPLS